MAGIRKAMAIENPDAAEVTRDALYRGVTEAKARKNRIKAALINLCTEVDDCSGPSCLCRSTIRASFESGHGIFMLCLQETCHVNFMSVRDDN